MAKIILGIHGLGNKPPYHILQQWWEMSISDGLRARSKYFPLRNFRMVYWANIIHPHPLDINETDRENPLFIADPYSPEGRIEKGDPEPLQKRIRDYLEKQVDKLLLNEDLTINFSAITDYIIQHFFHDLDVYYSTSLEHGNRTNNIAREAIRQQLARKLREHQHDEILLIAHSMGSIIAYDVMTQVVPDIAIDTFVTCGSPLGIPVIMSKIKTEQRGKVKQLTVPDNVTHRWYNLSDLGDRVAINYNLADDFQQNSRGISIIDKQVLNTYQYNGKKNPHKSYGYLRTPEMAEIIYAFLCRGKSPISIWLTDKLYRLFARTRQKLL